MLIRTPASDIKNECEFLKDRPLERKAPWSLTHRSRLGYDFSKPPNSMSIYRFDGTIVKAMLVNMNSFVFDEIVQIMNLTKINACFCG